MSLLDRIVVVLYEPQDPVNIAATARAMKNMGVSALRLIRPVSYQAERLEFVAHGTADLIAAARHEADLDAAIADCADVVAFTARRRAAKRTVLTPREMAGRLLDTAAQGDRVAVLFGREDAGLPNAAVDRARAVCTIPTSAHASLNLAQAVVIALYELHLAAGDSTRVLAPPRHHVPPARAEQFRTVLHRRRSRADRDRLLQDAAPRTHHADGPLAHEPCGARWTRDYAAPRDGARGLANARPLGHHTAHRMTL